MADAVRGQKGELSEGWRLFGRLGEAAGAFIQVGGGRTAFERGARSTPDEP